MAPAARPPPPRPARPGPRAAGRAASEACRLAKSERFSTTRVTPRPWSPGWSPRCRCCWASAAPACPTPRIFGSRRWASSAVRGSCGEASPMNTGRAGRARRQRDSHSPASASACSRWLAIEAESRRQPSRRPLLRGMLPAAGQHRPDLRGQPRRPAAGAKASAPAASATSCSRGRSPSATNGTRPAPAPARGGWRSHHPVDVGQADVRGTRSGGASGRWPECRPGREPASSTAIALRLQHAPEARARGGVALDAEDALGMGRPGADRSPVGSRGATKSTLRVVLQQGAPGAPPGPQLRLEEIAARFGGRVLQHSVEQVAQSLPDGRAPWSTPGSRHRRAAVQGQVADRAAGAAARARPRHRAPERPTAATRAAARRPGGGVGAQRSRTSLRRTSGPARAIGVRAAPPEPAPASPAPEAARAASTRSATADREPVRQAQSRRPAERAGRAGRASSAAIRSEPALRSALAPVRHGGADVGPDHVPRHRHGLAGPLGPLPRGAATPAAGPSSRSAQRRARRGAHSEAGQLLGDPLAESTCRDHHLSPPGGWPPASAPVGAGIRAGTRTAPPAAGEGRPRRSAPGRTPTARISPPREGPATPAEGVAGTFPRQRVPRQGVHREVPAGQVVVRGRAWKRDRRGRRPSS